MILQRKINKADSNKYEFKGEKGEDQMLGEIFRCVMRSWNKVPGRLWMPQPWRHQGQVGWGPEQPDLVPATLASFSSLYLLLHVLLPVPLGF